MATPSQVKAALDEIAETIARSRSAAIRAQASIAEEAARMSGLPSKYSDVITTINGYTPTGAFETLAKAERTALANEFGTLNDTLDDAITALNLLNFNG